MRVIKRVLITLLTALLFVPCAYADPPDIRTSVVHLYALGYDEENAVVSRWSGTGFAVGRAGEDTDIFLTNWHVATGSGNFPADRVRLWLLHDNTRLNGDKTPDDAVECTVLRTTDGFPDVAVIQTMEPVTGYPALPLLSSRQVLDTTCVYSLGFPGLAATRYGMDSGPEDVVVTSGTVRQHLRMQKAGNTWSLIHSAAIRHGNSGGPLVNEQGIVIGQNTYGFEDDIGLFCALYIDYAMQMLDELGIAYTAAAGPSKLTVFVADVLHCPDLSDGAAAAVFAIACIATAGFVFYFFRTMHQAYLEIRSKQNADAARKAGEEPQ